jgi:hypothetical protein
VVVLRVHYHVTVKHAYQAKIALEQFSSAFRDILSLSLSAITYRLNAFSRVS